MAVPSVQLNYEGSGEEPQRVISSESAASLDGAPSKDGLERLATSAAALMAVLSNEVRVEILAHLALAEQCVADIAEALQLDASTVSHALKRLQDAHLVEHRVVLKRHIYRLTSAVHTTIQNDSVQIRIATETLDVSIKAPRR